jgi:superfamily II DNA helicase RecQ
VDCQVTDFNDNQQEKQPDEDTLHQDKELYTIESIKELFDFSVLESAMGRLYRLNEEDIARFYKTAEAKIKDILNDAKEKIVNVSVKFCKQLDNLSKDDSNIINERIGKGQQYFITELNSLNALILLLKHLEFDNKEIEQGVKALTTDIAIEKETKHRLLQSIEGKDFDVSSYIQLRNNLLAQGEKLKLTSIAIDEKAKTSSEDDIKNKDLYYALKQWRLELSKELNMPAYVVLSQKALINISNEEPITMKQLSAIKGIGSKTMEKYSESIMEIIANNTLIQ